MTNFSTHVRLYSHDAAMCLRQILNSDDFQLPHSTTCDDQNIEAYISNRHQKRALRYLYRHKLLRRQHYLYEGRKLPQLSFDVQSISKHFNVEIQPYYRNSNRNKNRFITDRLHEELQHWVNIYDISDNAKRFIKNYIAKATNAEYFLGQDRHFDLTSDGRLTYTPANKATHINENQKWVASCRQQIKYGKGLRKILAPIAHLFSDQMFENFHNYLHKKYHFSDRFEVVSGSKILEYYHHESYASNSGTLNNSCMKYDECQEYLQLYAFNPDVCKMVVSLNDDNMVTGRALLWTTTNNHILMDRIYGNDVTTGAFLEYAQQNGYGYKQKQTYQNATFILPNGSTSNDVTVQLSELPEDFEFPYMDTFKYLKDWDKTLSSQNHGANMCLESTSGGYTEYNHVTLVDGTSCDEDDARWCQNEEEYYHADDCDYSHIEQTYIPCTHSVWVEDEESYVHEDNPEYLYADDTEQTHHIDKLEFSDYDQCYYRHDYFECPLLGIVGINQKLVIKASNGEYLHFSEDNAPESIISYLRQQYSLEDVQLIISSNPDVFPITTP